MTNDSNLSLEYNLPQNAYVNFDAVSLKAFMIEQLNKGGYFTDQNYEGSNLSSLLDILAYYTHVLMFYLNQTSSESMFSQTTIYENMNKIVKLIDYKPTGQQTSMSPIWCQASTELPIGSYVIRKYSYFLIDNIQYTFNNDLTFEKTLSGTETIDSINNDGILYQGAVSEYPIYTASGVEYETVPVVVDNLVDSRDTRFISHGSISVYVKEVDSGLWFEYLESGNLYLNSGTDRVVDIRLNESGHYEVKFGNNIFGKKLNDGDEVAIFYILSDGQKGYISKEAINGNKLFIYNSQRFTQIYNDISLEYSQVIDVNLSKSLLFKNPSNSTLINDAETVEDIRSNTPTFLSTQLRLVTERDYEVYLKKSIPNILNDVKVVNNKKYLNEYIDYFYRICVDPNKVNRVILNQVNFADSCDFNNVNVFCVPTFTLKEESYPEFLTNSFKTVVKNVTEDSRMLSNEVVPRDPVYMAYDLGITNTTPDKSVYKDTKLIIVREGNNKINKNSLKRQVSELIVNYFDPKNMHLGQTIDMAKLTTDILNLEGVGNIRTVNTAENATFNGLSFVSWNPMFEGVDVNIINQTTTLEFFKFPYLFRPDSFINRIDVIDE